MLYKSGVQGGMYYTGMFSSSDRIYVHHHTMVTLTRIVKFKSNDEDLVQSEPKLNPENQGGKQQKSQITVDNKRTYGKPSEQLHPKWWPLSCLNFSK